MSFSLTTFKNCNVASQELNRPKMAEERGFVSGKKGTTNAVYNIWTLTEQALEVKKERGIFVLQLHKCIWQCTTWWDNHTTNTVEDRWKRDKKKYVLEQTAPMQVDGKISSFKKTTCGVRDVCFSQTSPLSTVK